MSTQRQEGFALLSQRIRIYFWADEPPAWFGGVIDDYTDDKKSSLHGCHYINFDDGSKDWYNLVEEHESGHLEWAGGAWPTGAATNGRSRRLSSAVTPPAPKVEVRLPPKRPHSEGKKEKAKAIKEDEREVPKKRARAGAAKAVAGGGKAKSPAKGKRKAGGDDGSDGEYLEEEVVEEEEEEEEDEQESDEDFEDIVDSDEEEKPRAKSSAPRGGKSGGATGKRGGKSGGAGCGGVAAGRVAAARSVASRGLPQGSLAIGRGGFELRSLDGVLPLISADGVRKAMRLVSSGQPQAAARELRIDAPHCVRAFCKAACERLGISPPKDVHLAGGSALIDELRGRLDAGTMPISTPLPGRLVVVRAGTAVNDETGEALCPATLVDRVFESAEELHEATGGVQLATYELEVCADPAFAPWAVMAQRLSSAGLLQMESEDGTYTPAARVKAAPLVVVRALRHHRAGIV